MSRFDDEAREDAREEDGAIERQRRSESQDSCVSGLCRAENCTTCYPLLRLRNIGCTCPPTANIRTRADLDAMRKCPIEVDVDTLARGEAILKRREDCAKKKE